MEKEHINPPGFYKHPAYTRVITVKGPCKFIFIAGHVSSDEKTYAALHKGDLRAQYLNVLDGLTQQLKAAGATWEDVVRRRLYTVDMDALMKLMRDPTIKVPGHRNPTTTSTFLGVSRLTDPDFLVEIDLTAVVDA